MASCFPTLAPYCFFAAQCNVNNFLLRASIATAAAEVAATCGEGVNRAMVKEGGRGKGRPGKSSAVVSLDINVICGCHRRRRQTASSVI